jgi:hypothetical protein
LRVTVTPETEQERRFVSDPELQEGAAWGDPRPGHPEGAVAAHIVDVLDNVDVVRGASGIVVRIRKACVVRPFSSSSDQ